MAQHDYVIDNGPGLAVRTDINAVLQAIVSNNAGNIEPQNLFPGMLWLDTSITPDGQIRMRNQANSAWVPPMLDLPASFVALTRITASTTTFQYNSDTRFAIVEVLGGGGGGGSAPLSPSQGNASCGSGGGGGGYSRIVFLITPAIRAATKTIVVGVAGSGGTAGGAGGTGGNSSYADGTSSLAANGGLGGTGLSSGTLFAPRAGGYGGAATGSQIVRTGNLGDDGWCFGTSVFGIAGAVAMGGNGANSLYGSGGLGAKFVDTSAAASVGAVGTGFGSGGGGAGIVNSAPAAAGGPGTPGLVIITEYR